MCPESQFGLSIQTHKPKHLVISIFPKQILSRTDSRTTENKCATSDDDNGDYYDIFFDCCVLCLISHFCFFLWCWWWINSREPNILFSFFGKSINYESMKKATDSFVCLFFCGQMFLITLNNPLMLNLNT